jgi:hypothetical protein
MFDPRKDWEEFGTFIEFYELEESVEVVGTNEESYRIDIMKGHGSKGATRPVWYVARYFMEEHYNLQPTFPQANGEFEKKPQNVRLWTKMHMLNTEADTPEKALAKALDFLSDLIRRAGEKENSREGESPSNIVSLFDKKEDE